MGKRGRQFRDRLAFDMEQSFTAEAREHREAAKAPEATVWERLRHNRHARACEKAAGG